MRTKSACLLTTERSVSRKFAPALSSPPAFGANVDYARLVKLCVESPESAKRYSPAQCIGCEQKRVTGIPIRNTSVPAMWNFQSEHENVNVALHPADKCLLKEDRESRRRCCAVLHLLTTSFGSSDTQNDSRDCGWCHRSSFEDFRNHCFVGSRNSN
jgi:hypothetical protein